ncbi:MAG: ribosome biogenesis GTPase Der [Candidatus Hydrogenedentes bacterium]|nr:ribosome biogenesis GTPase Der [Candidatus Hydrogenedentota bacterium]
MAKKKKLPLVAIVGRPNVGKSTLYNRIAGRQGAIVHFEEGITRDRSYSTAEWEGRAFRVVDTGGIVENPIDPIIKKMQDQVHKAIEEARVIVFLIDGRQELTRVDEQLREELFKYGKPVVLAVNKLDNPKLEQNRFDFYRLGFGEPFAISSTHGLGINALLDEIVKHLPEPATAPQPTEAETEEEAEEEVEPAVTKVAVIGKPNVGKSSFVNAILNEERVIVDETPGTTRDAVDIEFHWKGNDYLFIDTAGLRKKAGIKRFVEHFSVSRSLRAIRRADVCLVMMDATEGITEQDKRVVDYVQEHGTAMVLVWTKWDLVEHKEARLKSLKEDLDFKAPFLKWVPWMTISNLTRLRLFKVFDYIDNVAAEARKRIGTAELNKFMEEIRAVHAPAVQKGRVAKIRYATQSGVRPTTFILFVNQKRLFHFSYMRFIENRLREKYGFEGVPIRLELREEQREKKS